MKKLTNRVWVRFAAVPILGALAIGCAGTSGAEDSQGHAQPTGSSADALESLAQFGHKDVCALRAGEFARCFAQVLVAPDGSIKSFALPSGYGPADIQSAYNLPSAVNSSATVAIVDAFDDPNAASDLATYRSTFGLPPAKFKKVNQSGVEGSYPTADSGWASEIALDIEAVSAVYPDANILLVEANSSSGADLYAAVDTAVRLGATVVSNSWGGSEYSGQTTDDAHFNHPGVAIFVSSGDAGAEAGAEFPSSSRFVISVGGTKIDRDSSARGWAEVVWNSNNGANAGGSGQSRFEAKPSWQPGTATRRTTADVSAVGFPSFAVFDSFGVGGWAVFGGTSLSSPIVAAIFALTGKGGSDASIIYRNTADFYDITSGTNRVRTSTRATYLNTAGVGYDGPTGIGTPNGAAFVSAQ